MKNEIPKLTQMSFEEWRDNNMDDFNIREKAEIDPYHPDLCHEYIQRTKTIERLWKQLFETEAQA